MLTFLLVAIWPLAVSHCKLEQMPGFQFLACVEEPSADPCHADDGCETDGCVAFEQGLYKTETGQIDLPAPVLAFLFELPSVHVEAIPRLLSNPAGSWLSPPEISSHWQFHLRAAQLPRAPSVVS